MKKTVLITGATGYFGQVLLRDLVKSRKYNIHLLLEDINDYQSVNRHFSLFSNVDAVVHLAALLPSYKGSEQDIIQTNYLATRNLASLCGNTHFIFLSTESVFKSDPNIAWDINDMKNPETTYGISKDAAEDFLLKESGLSDVTILRTSMLYGYDQPKRKNFLRFLYECMENKTEVEVFTDVYNRPTHVNDLSVFILDIIEKKLTGIIHAAAEAYVSRYELGKIFCDAHGYSRDLLIPVTQPIGGRMHKQLNLKPSERFTRQIKLPLRERVITCLEKLEI